MAVFYEIVKSLAEYYDCIVGFQQEWTSRTYTEKEAKKDGKIKTMWFRAESNLNYSLIPSLYRQSNAKSIKNLRGYSNLHHMENMRIQHYQAKNYHYFTSSPSMKIEWLETMQHHGVYTRLLDWSESSTHSLIFALEPFLNPKSPLYYMREKVSPCVWVLDPNGLNRNLMQKLSGNDKLLKELLIPLKLPKKELANIINDVKKLPDLMNPKNGGLDHIANIVNLSQLDNEMQKDSEWLRQAFLGFEVFNPVFYFLARIYSEGYMLEDYTLPPLAVVEPYHSERIKAQKGVFTVFPFYKGDEKSKVLEENNLSPCAMSYNEIAQKYLRKIVLLNPQRIAEELVANGINESWLYPEMPIVSGEIENRRIY